MSRPMSRLLKLVPIQPLLPLILITPLQDELIYIHRLALARARTNTGTSADHAAAP